MSKPDIGSRFSAGKLFGEVLLEVLGIFAGGAAAAKLAGKIPELAKMAQRLEKIGKAIEVRVKPAAKAPQAPKAPEVAKPASKSIEAPAEPTKPTKALEEHESKPPEKSSPKREPVVQNGYRYEFDEKGRVSRVEGELHAESTQGRNAKAQREAGGEYRLKDDDGGHFIARRFEGPKNDFNHFAQNGNFNKSAYAKVENAWERALKAGETVKVEITPIYEGNSLRPTSLTIKQWIGGIPDETLTFKNAFGG